MLKPVALRLAGLLSAGLDQCLRFRQALHSTLSKRSAPFAPTSNGPLIGLLDNADACGPRKGIVACGIRDVYVTECLGSRDSRR
jgi:hypothetical protein